MLGVIFDCDGTLLDSMEAWREMESELARRAGAELSEADRVRLTTLTTPEAGVFFHERLGLGSSPDDVVDMINDYMLHYYSERSRPREGALEFVAALAERGARLSVASSSTQEFLQAGLAHTGFLPLMDAVVSVDDVGRPKREPAVYDRAREVMGTDRAATWGVEDAAYAVRSLKSGGYWALSVYDCDISGTYDELAASADLVARSFTELDPDAFVARARACVQAGAPLRTWSPEG